MNTLRAAYDMSLSFKGFTIPMLVLSPDKPKKKNCTYHAIAEELYEVAWDHEPSADEAKSADIALLAHSEEDTSTDMSYLAEHFKAMAVPVISVRATWPITLDMGENPKPEDKEAAAKFLESYVPGSQQEPFSLSPIETAAVILRLAYGDVAPNWVKDAIAKAAERAKDVVP